MSRLTRESGIEAGVLSAASLLPIASAIGLESGAISAIWRWILALGSRNRKQHGGLQYCSLCLATDAQPYFRLQWRLAWHTCCAVHDVGLRDRCCHCQLPIEPNRLSAFDVMSTCSTCKRDLRHGVMPPAAKAALAFQERADRVVITGSGLYGTHHLQVKEWFHLVRYFLMLVRCVARRQKSGLGKCLSVLDNGSCCLRPPPITGLGFELLPTSERSSFLESVSALIQAGPEQLRSAVVADSLNDTSLRQGWRSLPPYIDDIVREMPQRVLSRNAKKSSDPAPVSRQIVLYKWARLQRRMRLVS
jgi:hypothetical protein